MAGRIEELEKKRVTHPLRRAVNRNVRCIVKVVVLICRKIVRAVNCFELPSHHGEWLKFDLGKERWLLN